MYLKKSQSVNINILAKLISNIFDRVIIRHIFNKLYLLNSTKSFGIAAKNF